MTEAKPTWMKMKPAEIESIVLDLAKKGETPSKIGIILRDQHGVPKAKLLGKKISQIMKENNLPLNHDKTRVTNKLENLKSHMLKNHKDQSAKRAYTKQLWSMHKIEAEAN